jgi:demethylmenaquinone methyltransferase/2-methoxy-6-polyprenyl-1,4-benzoquinol methylase
VPRQPGVDRTARLIETQRTFYDQRASDYRDETVPDRRVVGAPSPDLVRGLVDAFAPSGDVLEIACGTGTFTRELLRHAAKLTAVDGSRRMLERCAHEVADTNVAYIHADVFEWQPDRRYDAVFFGFWLSHVPPSRFDEFWTLVRSCLGPHGRVGFVDEDDRGSSHDDVRVVEGVPVARRRLRDGRTFDVIKVFWNARELEAKLRSLGWHSRVRSVGETFLYGSASA